MCYCAKAKHKDSRDEAAADVCQVSYHFQQRSLLRGTGPQAVQAMERVATFSPPQKELFLGEGEAVLMNTNPPGKMPVLRNAVC